MPQVLVRGIGPGVVRKLKSRARRHGRSLQAELQEIVEKAAAGDRGDVEATVKRVRAMFAGRRFGDSAALIRRDRAR
jgi:plasmid stability protein